jgi:enterochelin esterase-like enzyme
MKAVLDNLIHRLEIPDCIVASPTRPIASASTRTTSARAFLTEELMPDLDAAPPAPRSPQARCLMGASFGGVAALSTAFRYPGFWGRLLLQSGAFAFTDIGKQEPPRAALRQGGRVRERVPRARRPR